MTKQRKKSLVVRLVRLNISERVGFGEEEAEYLHFDIVPQFLDKKVRITIEEI